MRAIVLSGAGGVEVLAIEDRPDPAFGPDEVRVRVRATALNRADLLQRRGLYPAPPGAPPDIPGLELAGEVEAVGARVASLRPGDRVMGIVAGGAHAEKVVVHERACIPIPRNLTWEEAAAVPEAFLTAFDALVLQAGLAAGETVLLPAAASGVGTAALQIATLIGALPIALSRTPAKRARLESMGVRHVLDPASPDVADAIRHATSGRGVDVILELVGASSWPLDMDVIAERGRLLLVGTMAGATVQADLGLLMRKRLTVVGTVLRSRPLEEKITLVQQFARRIVPCLADARLRPVVDRVLPWESVAAGHELLESGSVFGKIVLHVASTLALAVLVLAGSGCALFTPGQRSAYTLSTPLKVEDPAFRRSLDNFGSTMVGGNDGIVLENGDGVFPAMLADIARAEVCVHLETYIFQDDEVGKRFADALIAASARGVQVRLLVDAQGSSLGTLRETLTKGGVLCKDYRPASTHAYYGRRTHRKLLIVDGKIGFTGGFCIDDRWLGNARNKKEWHDSTVRVTGPVVAQMQAIFGEDWTFTTGEILASEDIYPKLSPTGSMQSQAMKTSKGDASSLPKMLYFMAIHAARTSIHIQNPYFLPDQQIRNALVDAAKRGVDVKVMVPGPHMDIPPARLASRHDFGELLAGGVKIFEYQPAMIHSKTLVVDGLFATIGSINFDARSMSKNAEESVSFYDRDFARSMEEMFQRDLAVCHEVTYEGWKHRGGTTRVFEFFSRWFRPLY